MFVFGITFEFPVVLVSLELAGVLTPKRLSSWRRWAIVLITIVAAVITPSGDPFSMLALAIPLYFFYEISIVLGKLLAARPVTASGPGDRSGSGSPRGSASALDPFQSRAMRSLDEGLSVLVSAPTGRARPSWRTTPSPVPSSRGRRAFYTTPLKALSNQKLGRALADVRRRERRAADRGRLAPTRRTVSSS